MTRPSPEKIVVGILQTTWQAVNATDERLKGANPHLADLREGLGSLGTQDLVKLFTGEDIEGAEAFAGVADSLKLWSGEEAALGLHRIARDLYVERQNQAVRDILGGSAVRVTRLEGARPRALATHPEDGFTAVDEPVMGTFVEVMAEHGRIGVGIRPRDPFEETVKPRWIAHVIGPDDEPQLDIKITSRGK